MEHHLCAVKKAFQVKLLLWETQMHQCNLPHFPCCQVMLNQVGRTVFPNMHFGDFEEQKKNFELLRNPFAVNVETAPVQIQMELIELQCNGTLKAKYDTAWPAQFIHSIPAEMLQLCLHAARTLCMFGSTYLCEKLFSHLQSILRISTTQNLTPNINELIAKKRCQASSSDKMT
uniref:HAT C-terminal dimerisation domain-containing protein n=1 Tax=Erpetoichthys calabaricus TaxID=27687 RepID=A0A8C4STI9_ERPCA